MIKKIKIKTEVAELSKKEEPPIRSMLLLSVGDKIAPARNTKEDCEDFAAKLAEAGYKTRIAQHSETGLWTVAIIARSQEALTIENDIIREHKI